MEAIIVLVSCIGWKVNDIDFLTLYFYISLSMSLYRAFRKAVKYYTNDKTTRR